MPLFLFSIIVVGFRDHHFACNECTMVHKEGIRYIRANGQMILEFAETFNYTVAETLCSVQHLQTLATPLLWQLYLV